MEHTVSVDKVRKLMAHISSVVENKTFIIIQLIQFKLCTVALKIHPFKKNSTNCSLMPFPHEKYRAAHINKRR